MSFLKVIGSACVALAGIIAYTWVVRLGHGEVVNLLIVFAALLICGFMLALMKAPFVEEKHPSKGESKIKVTYFLSVTPKTTIGGTYSKTVLVDCVPGVGWTLEFETLCKFAVRSVEQSINDERNHQYRVSAFAEHDEQHVWYADIRQRLEESGWVKLAP